MGDLFALQDDRIMMTDMTMKIFFNDYILKEYALNEPVKSDQRDQG